MSVMSIRFTDPDVAARLKTQAKDADLSISALAERIIDEGLRQAKHPSIVFRDGPTGRRPALTMGPEVLDVIGYLVGGNVPANERRRRAAENLCVPVSAIDAALAYYADHTAEIEDAMADREARADAERLAWKRQNELLTK